MLTSASPSINFQTKSRATILREGIVSKYAYLAHARLNPQILIYTKLVRVSCLLLSCTSPNVHS